MSLGLPRSEEDNGGILGVAWAVSSSSVQGGPGGWLGGGWDQQLLADGAVSEGGKASAALRGLAT